MLQLLWKSFFCGKPHAFGRPQVQKDWTSGVGFPKGSILLLGRRPWMDVAYSAFLNQAWPA